MCSFDVIALVETFFDRNFKITKHFPDFDIYQTSAVKLTHHGRRSGGVVLVKKHLMRFVCKIETTYDHIICLKLSSALLATHSDVMYIAAYVPPILSPYNAWTVGSCHIEQTEHCMLDVFENNGATPVILCGDMNSRTGHLQPQLDADSISDPIDQRSDTYSCTRASDDSATNVFGWQCLSLWINFELCILNGSCTPESSKLCMYIIIESSTKCRRLFCHVH